MSATIHHLPIAYKPAPVTFADDRIARLSIRQAAFRYADMTSGMHTIVELLHLLDAMRARAKREMLSDADYECLIRTACSHVFGARGPEFLAALLRHIASELDEKVAP